MTTSFASQLGSSRHSLGCLVAIVINKQQQQQQQQQQRQKQQP
jgi:hypothetical protein